MAAGRRRLLRWLLPVVALAGLIIFHPLWLTALGRFLIHAEGPAQADIIVVLGGGWNGNRILGAAKLVRQGYAPKVLVSGPGGFYGQHECDLAIPFAVQHGYPREWFVPFPNGGLNTKEEAGLVLAELRKRSARSVLVVTSEGHTRRAGGIYRTLGRDLNIRLVGVPDGVFRPDGWWRHREGQKVFFLEWVKLVTSQFGI